jgi:hypothetical protein
MKSQILINDWAVEIKAADTPRQELPANTKLDLILSNGDRFAIRIIDDGKGIEVRKNSDGMSDQIFVLSKFSNSIELK